MQIRAVTILMLLVFGCACLHPAQAQDTTLTIRPLRDGGGLERGLNIRLTTALSRFLTDNAAKSVQVNNEANPISPQVSKTLRYTLEGDLAFANGADEQNARFLLVMRLYRDSAARVLVGQWAGTADSLRSLTVNLRRDPRVHTLGLVGEIGSRIVACLNADTATAYAQWLRLLSQLPAQNPLFDMVSADDKARPMRQVETGASFRLRSRRDISCRAFLLLNDPVNGLHLARLSESGECWTVSKGKTALSHAIMLPEGASEAWILTSPPAPLLAAQRARRGEGVIDSPSDALYFGSVDNALNTQRLMPTKKHKQSSSFSDAKAAMQENRKAPLLARCAARRGIGVRFPQDSPPVLMLEGVGNQPSHSEPAPELKQLLDEIARKPEMWRVQKLRITETK